MHSYESLLHCYQGLISLRYKCPRAIYRYMYKEIKVQYSSRINVRLIFLFFARKPEVSYQNLLMVKTFKKVNLPDFKFYLLKLIKYFPIWCNVKFSLLFSIVYCSENRLTINITPYGDFFFLLFYLPR